MTHQTSSLLHRAARAGRRGFTLIEILVVIVVIAILASVVAPEVMRNVDDARWNTAKSQIGTFGSALAKYRMDIGSYPLTEEGLEALNAPGSDASANKWRGPYMSGSIPLDPWGNPYYYNYPGVYNPNGYDLYSLGADGQEGGEGVDADILSWQ